MYSIDDLTDLSVLGYFGDNRDLEVQSEVFLALTTPLKSIPYYREYGTTIHTSENRPITITKLIRMTVEIFQAIQHYNDNIVSSQERRVAVLPDDVNFDDTNKANGESNIMIEYVPMWDINAKMQVSM